MDKKIGEYYHESFHSFLEALVNIGIFLPYYFSITALLKTLFDPWKNLTATKTERGFSFEAWVNRLGFNMVSRGMGFMIRSTLLFVYVLTLIIYMIVFPLLFIGYFIFFPIIVIRSMYAKSEGEKKQVFKNAFIKTHMLNSENFQEVEKWFEQLYADYASHKKWWKLSNLQSYPPIGRDWAAGYTPALDEFASELTNSIYQVHIKHVIGRGKELKVIERILSQSEEANVLLIGEEGVGRHTIVDALAKHIYEGTINSLLMYKRVLRVNMEKILTQYTDQQQRETFLENLLGEAAVAGNVILVIDNFDRYVSNGEQRIDLSIPFERYAKAAVQIIGITTPFLYQKYLVPNEKILRMFERIDVQEVTEAETMNIMLDKVEIFESRYNVLIPYETVQAAVTKSAYFISSEPFPEKAIQLLDSVCVHATQVTHEKLVKPAIVDAVLTEKTQIPTTLNAEMKEKLLHLEQLMQGKVIGQYDALVELSSAMRRAYLLYGKRKKPLASFLFLGPTGVGKTETAKAIADVFFGSDKHLIRFDMSEYQTREAIPSLVGSMETKNPGLLTEAIREHPYGVLLIDEMEKADKDLLNIFLTVLDEGYFTDGYGKHVDCKNLVIVATSNAGAAYIFEQLKTQAETSDFSATLIRYLVQQGTFSPEYLNRFDGVIAYRSLAGQNILDVAHKFLDPVLEQIYSTYKIKVTVSEKTLQDVTQKGYDPSFGARGMDRVLRHQIEDKLAKLIFEGKVKEGETIDL